MYWLILYCALSLSLMLKVSAAEEKDYKLIIDELHKEIDAENILQTNLSFDKTDELQVNINGEIKQLIDLDNNWQVSITIYQAKSKDEEYSQLMALPAEGVCDLMTSYYKTFFYEKLKNYANAPDPDKCPVTQDVYKIKDYPVDGNKFKQFLSPGFYRIEGILLQADEPKLKYVLEAHVE